MVFSELINTNIALEIADLLENGCISDSRLVSLLNEVASDNTAINTVNLFILKFICGEVSEKDLLIAINKYKTSRQSIVD